MSKKIAVLGGSTTKDIVQLMELFLLNYGIAPVFYESEYNQYFEDAMFPNPELERFAPDIIYFHTSSRNISVWPSIADSKSAVDELINAEYNKFRSMWDRIAEVYHCPIIQNNFELPFYRLLGNRDASDYRGRVNYAMSLNHMFYEYAQTHKNFYIHDILYEQALYGLKKWSDPYYWHMYKYACCVLAIPYLSFNISNIIKSIYGKNKKVLALDMDNTIWGGVIGDDGAENIEIGQENALAQTYSEFQDYIKQHKQLGVLLAVISKNDYENAISGLKRPDSVLKEEDFVSIKANWEPKDANLSKMAQELSLLPESFVFVDDNPAERHIVRDGVPGTAVPEIDTAENYINILDRAGFFEVTDFSDDDAKRTEMYRENAKRADAQSSFADYGEYLKSLEMKGTIRNFEPVYMSRIAQLTNKSNQFNLTTKRYSQTDIEQVSKNKEYITLYGKLEDKFGDNGVVSVVAGKQKKDELHIELWIMSCRVLKRDMEYAMMDELVKKCMERGINEIYGYYYPTVKNGMVKDFYEKQGFTLISSDEEGNTVWRYDISDGYTRRNSYILVNE